MEDRRRMMPKTIYITHNGKHPRHGWRKLFRKKKLDGPFAKSLAEAWELAEVGDYVSIQDGTWTAANNMIEDK